MRHALFGFAIALAIIHASANEFSDAFDLWPVDLRINGSILVGARLGDGSSLRQALIASEINATVGVLVEPNLPPEEFLRLATVFSNAQQYRFVRRDPKSDWDELEELLRTCQTLLWRSIEPLRDDQWNRLLRLQDDFARFLARGGTLVCLGPDASRVASISRTNVDGAPSTCAGLGLLPDCLIQLDDSPAVRQQILGALAAYPATVGIGLAKDTLLRLSGRRMSVIGPSTATFLLAAGKEGVPAREKTIAERRKRRQSANDYSIDLTQWRRQAIDRQLPVFPSADPPPPCVKAGTLVIVGGGGMPAGLMNDFVDMAGGVENARLVYVPCSESKLVSGDQRIVDQWRRQGVRHATTVHTKDRVKANEDPEFLRPLKDATGIWFGGGRQWNLADSYHGTTAQLLMKQVLQRGGVVGGSSAGASIQASFLARATPIENTQILAPGYLRGGLGFITGVAIDQHFSQRGRLNDMSQLVDKFPQILGIGIDEGTALVVRKSVGTVVGEGDVYFYNRDRPISDDGSDYVKLGAGSAYELTRRQVITRGLDE
jgi:cyanophycinase